MATKIRFRRNSAAEIAASNYVLAMGEPGFDTTNGVLKIGNGTDLWAGLPTPSAADVAALEASVATLLTGKVPTSRTVNGHPLSADVTVTKADVGLGSVDNTADSAKPVSTAQQSAIDAKVADAINDGTTSVAPSQNAVFDALALKQNLPAWVTGRAYSVGDIVEAPSLKTRLSCVTAHTSAAIFTDDLPKWSPVTAPPKEPLLLQRARLSKGGGIGVGTKAVVALRFDDWHESFQSTVYPLLTARGLPGGFGTISDLASQPWSDGDSSANIVTRNKMGIEVWSHGKDHKDPSPWDLMGSGGLYDQIVTSKATIEAWGVKVQGWMQPGATALGAATPYGTTFTTWDSLESYAGWLIRNTYALSANDLWGAHVRNIDTGAYHGAAHVTVSDGLTLAAVTAQIDDTINKGQAIQFMTHSGNLGVTGMSVADYTTFLDYLVTKRDAGLLEILTPSGLMFANRSTNRLNLVRKGDFEGISTADTSWNSWGTHTIETTGGHSGNNFLRFTSGDTGLLNQRYNTLVTQNLDGETFVFEGWARSNGAGTTTSRVLLQSYPTTTALNLSLTKASISTTWTKVVHAFTVPPGVNEILYAVGRNAGDGIDWDDITVKKV